MAWKKPLRAVPFSLLAVLAAPGAGSPAAVVTSGRVPVEGGSLYFESAGDGPVVVLVHDGLVASEAWRPVLERLAPYCRAVAYDRRGCGKSDPAPEKYSDIADLDAVVRNTGAGAVSIAASSYGSLLTLDYALEQPDRVNALVLVGPVVSGMPHAGHFLERNYRNFAPFSSRKDLEASIERWINDPYQLYYEAAGRGEAVVLLHGGFGDRRMWEAQFGELAADFRVIRFDFRGFGRSPPPGTVYSPAEDLCLLLEHLGVKRACLIGNSLGGTLAIDFTLLFPERVSHLAVISSGPGGYPVRKRTAPASWKSSGPPSARGPNARRRSGSRIPW
jgi:pimeloyl-ACP methyl ester carboxylesterase